MYNRQNFRENTMRERIRKEMGHKEIKEKLNELKNKNDEVMSKGERLIEKWEKRKEVDLIERELFGKGKSITEIAHEDLRKAVNLSYALENQSKYLAKLTETQVSNSFRGVTPTNLLRMVRLGYPNSVRGEIFHEFAMETMQDYFLYLDPVYGSSLRDGTAGNITYESLTHRYASEIEQDVVDAAGAGTTYSGTLTNFPIVPEKTWVLFANATTGDYDLIAQDDGLGGWVDISASGNILDTGGTNDIDYISGDYNLAFLAAPNAEIIMMSNVDFEEESNYSLFGDLELRIRRYNFNPRPFPLAFSWSLMSEFLLDSTVNVNTENILVESGREELTKSFDYLALKDGFRIALSTGNTQVFDADAGNAGTDSQVDRSAVLKFVIDQVGDAMLTKKARGGVSKIYGGSKAISYMSMIPGFSDANKQPAIGAHKTGSLMGIDLYKAPNIVPDNYLVCVYKNEQNPADVAIAHSVFIPFADTATLEFKNMYREKGIYSVQDKKVINKDYLGVIRLDNLDRVTQ